MIEWITLAICDKKTTQKNLKSMLPTSFEYDISYKEFEIYKYGSLYNSLDLFDHVRKLKSLKKTKYEIWKDIVWKIHVLGDIISNVCHCTKCGLALAHYINSHFFYLMV